jgi:hypothetical protein
MNMAAVMSKSNTIWWFLGKFWPTLLMSAEEAKFMYPIGEKLKMLMTESGYMHIQATKPDTVGNIAKTIAISFELVTYYTFFFSGVALNNDPIGLAAYIMEKFSSWTDMENRALTDGGLVSRFDGHQYSLDELLTNVMLYWVTNSVSSSMRIYAETFSIRSIGYETDE